MRWLEGALCRQPLVSRCRISLAVDRTGSVDGFYRPRMATLHARWRARVCAWHYLQWLCVHLFTVANNARALNDAGAIVGSPLSTLMLTFSLHRACVVLTSFSCMAVRLRLLGCKIGSSACVRTLLGHACAPPGHYQCSNIARQTTQLPQHQPTTCVHSKPTPLQPRHFVAQAYSAMTLVLYNSGKHCSARHGCGDMVLQCCSDISHLLSCV
jgi:hypothetical protein